MTQSSTTTVGCLVLGTLLLAGCASNKPPADQVFLMPAPAVYGEGHIDPFGGSALPADSPLPCILYATARAPTKEPEHFAYYSAGRGQFSHRCIFRATIWRWQGHYASSFPERSTT